MHRTLGESDSGVIAVAGVIVTEIAQREAVEVPTVSGVAEGAEVGVVRRDNQNFAAVANHTMELLHGTDHVGDVLDNGDGLERVETGIAERIGEMIQVGQNV